MRDKISEFESERTAALRQIRLLVVQTKPTFYAEFVKLYSSFLTE